MAVTGVHICGPFEGQEAEVIFAAEVQEQVNIQVSQKPMYAD